MGSYFQMATRITVYTSVITDQRQKASKAVSGNLGDCAINAAVPKIKKRPMPTERMILRGLFNR